MTYFICAWVQDGSIAMVQTDTNPITENHMPDLAHEARIVAEVSGDYQDASEVFPLLTWDGAALGGLAFVTQEMIAP